jgi:hypothetical protein
MKGEANHRIIMFVEILLMLLIVLVIDLNPRL